ncbi:uncharacterized protein LOC117737514 isoform X3 [Cyclopterus lumpus]|uniref:uncharacterized protein LOC117737514 isoform X3 n=1 Tax=Cyclopterus lumpus TaxID=8103 RepID=UPI001486DA5C|nr:uncharacterized protein LOC117737514 isoform X3 [Cyclopterus lumpus]
MYVSTAKKMDTGQETVAYRTNVRRTIMMAMMVETAGTNTMVQTDFKKEGRDVHVGRRRPPLRQLIMIREVKHTHTHTHTAACNEETLPALTSHIHTHTHTHTQEQQQALIDIIKHLEKQQKPFLTHTYAKLLEGSFKDMPTAMVEIQGKQLSFLVDSGATHSVIQQKHFPNQKLSGRHVYSQGASGLTVVENFTTPMTSTHTDSTDAEPDITTKHSFLLSSLCPINLMGRDLMCSFGISLISTPTGLRVVRQRIVTQMVKSTLCDPLFVYQWWIPVDALTHLSRLTAERVQAGAQCMASSHLHCTAHVSHEPDKSYEQLFLQDLNDYIQCSTLFWSTFKSAVSVSLTSSQQPLFQVPGSFPHISLSKATMDQWRDLGPFVATCETLTDWQSTADPTIMRSHSTGFFKQPFAFSTPALRSIYVMDENNTLPDAHTDMFVTDVSSISPALSSVPATLWASHKYDVGLIKNCHPMVITPRSDFRPHKHQYPLRQEAIDGITPMFNSLLQAGVIVPCPDSPDGEEHNCLAELQAQCTPRPDLSDTPLLNSDWVMYVDGSASRDPLTGTNLVGFCCFRLSCSLFRTSPVSPLSPSSRANRTHRSL